MIFYQIFFLPQVKWWAIITFKHGIYETLAPNPDPNLPQPPDIGRNSDGASPIRGPRSIPAKGNCYNPRTRDDFDVTPGPVTKHAKRNKTMSKNLSWTLCRKILTSLQFFEFTANLEQPGSGTLDAESAQLILSLI